MVEHPSGVDISGPGASVVDRLAEVLADVTRVESVPVDSHFFDDLGANSLVMAQFCARVRKIPDLPSASMKDIYRNPTIQSLAAALAQTDPGHATKSIPSNTVTHQAAPEPVTQPGRLPYVLCGT